MKQFEFSIIASGLDPNADNFETLFYDAGCDDATVSFQKGRIIVDFARDAASINEAIASAIDNVCAAGAKVDRVEPDPLVNLSDIAARTELTAFLDRGLPGYAVLRDRPDLPHTSRMSPHLRFGEISPFQIWHACRHAAEASGHRLRGDTEKLLSELAWRVGYRLATAATGS